MIKYIGVFALMFVVFVQTTHMYDASASDLEVKLVQVQPQLSLGYLQFKFDVLDNFVPLNLTTKVISPAPSQDIAFKTVSVNEGKNVRFRNSEKYNFRLNDLIQADLVYELSRNSTAKVGSMSFNYTVGDMQSSFLFIKKNEPNMHGTVIEHLPTELAGSIRSEIDKKPKREERIGIDRNKNFLVTALTIALNDGKFNNKLLLRQPPAMQSTDHNAIEALRRLIVHKLKLPHLEYQILNAKYTDDGLLFEMATASNSLEVLTQATILVAENLKIERTDRSFFEPLISVRSNF